MAGNELVIQMEEGQQEVVADKVVKPADGNKHFRTLADLKSEILQLGNKETSSSATKKRRCPKVPKWLLPSDAKGSSNAKGSKPSDKCLSPSDAKGSVLSDNHHYMPKIMSFGPYHHGNPKLERGETIKLKLAADGIQLLVAKDQPIEKAVDHVYSMISGKVEELMGSYDMKSIEKYSAEQFSVMILVDGCALLWYIFLCVCSGGDHEDYNIGYQDLSLIHQDALLLENQLPYQLLFQDLLKMTEPDLTIDSWRVIILEFFGMIEESFFQEFFGMNEQSFLRKMKNYCCALLVWITQIIKRKSETSEKESKRCHHLLDLYRNYLLGPTPKHTENGNSGNENGKNGHKVKALVGDVKEQVMASFRNVKELMAAGIRIKPSPTHHLRDISFTSNCVTACLRLPPITIDKSTKTLFFNLIAYEMSSDVDHHFISYLRFLDSLIDHADDVKELQSAGVLQNNLGTHEEVAEFFNTVSADLESNFLAYKDVRVKIRNHLKSHYNSRLKMWMTQCLDTYFGSPWTIIAWVGVALALFFTAVQTYFTVFPR